jgi:hypothetical protein
MLSSWSLELLWKALPRFLIAIAILAVAPVLAPVAAQESDDAESTPYIRKYVCPSGYDWSGADIEAVATDCITTVGDVPFVVLGEDFEETQASDLTGLVVSSIPPIEEGWNDYLIVEEMPEGYGEARVSCSHYPSFESPTEYQEFEVNENRIRVTIDPGYSLDCAWFNQLAQHDLGPASVTLNVYTCPEGYDPLARDAEPLTDCNLPTEDITFTLPDGASASTGTGGAPSTIIFSNLQAESYLVTAVLPEGVESAFVWQCSSDQRSFVYPFSPFAVIPADGRLPVELVAGEDLECDWFNVVARQ